MLMKLHDFGDLLQNNIAGPTSSNGCIRRLANSPPHVVSLLLKTIKIKYFRALHAGKYLRSVFIKNFRYRTACGPDGMVVLGHFYPLSLGDKTCRATGQ